MFFIASTADDDENRKKRDNKEEENDLRRHCYRLSVQRRKRERIMDHTKAYA